jgi:hypothetical protein
LPLKFLGGSLASSFSLLIALEAKLVELRSCLSRLLNFVWSRDSSLVGRLDDVPRCIWGVVGLGAHQGAVMTLLVEELWTGHNLQVVMGPPLALPDKGPREVFEYNKDAAGHIVHRLSKKNIVHNVSNQMLQCASGMTFLK